MIQVIVSRDFRAEVAEFAKGKQMLHLPAPLETQYRQETQVKTSRSSIRLIQANALQMVTA